jgi:hypothetical protein
MSDSSSKLGEGREAFRVTHLGLQGSLVIDLLLKG